MVALQETLSKFWRAVIEFDMLQANDKILVGLSGGKDSSFLLQCFSLAKKILPFKIEVAAFTIDPCFTEDFPMRKLEKFCESLQIDFFHEQVNIKSVIAEKKYKSPCFTCAYFRRAGTNRVAKEKGFNKVALGHHHDDAVETFTMNILTSGQVKTFLPVTYLSKMDLQVLRPLVYYREQEIVEFNRKYAIEAIKSPCPYNGCTKREEVKSLLQYLNTNIDPQAYEHLAAAMRLAPQQDLWPEKINRDVLAKKHRDFWYQKSVSEQ